MSLPWVDLRLPDGRVLRVHPGAILGRLATSPARIDDPRLHEAHALLSHRGQKLWLIALMTRFKVDQRREHEVSLEEGMRVHLLDDFVVEVVALSVPRTLTVIELRRRDGSEGWSRLDALRHDAYYTVTPGDPPTLQTGELASALWHLWSNGVGWTLVSPSHPPALLVDGEIWEHADWQLRARRVDAPAAGTPRTLVEGRIFLPARLALREDAVELSPEGGAPFLVRGHGAFILRALLEARRKADSGAEEELVWVDWEPLASRHWRGTRRFEQLANLWYKALSRLRKRLEQAQLDPDLVRSDGDRRVCLDTHALVALP